MPIHSNTEFERELKDCQFILQYLATYPEILAEMEITNLLSPANVFQQFFDWKQLVSKYKGLEKEFYRDFWLPIEADNYQFFIDLSDPNYPIIETIYVMGEKHCEEYISSNLFESISQFLLLIEVPNQLSNYFEKHLMLKYFNYMDDFDFENDSSGGFES